MRTFTHTQTSVCLCVCLRWAPAAGTCVYEEAPLAAASKTSLDTIRPFGPEPWTTRRSTPLSLAVTLAYGDATIRPACECGVGLIEMSRQECKKKKRNKEAHHIACEHCDYKFLPTPKFWIDSPFETDQTLYPRHIHKTRRKK